MQDKYVISGSENVILGFITINIDFCKNKYFSYGKQHTEKVLTFNSKLPIGMSMYLYIY